MIKPNKSLLLTLIILFFALLNSNTGTISLSERHDPSGSMISVPLTYNNAANVAGGEFVIQYDPTLLEFIDVTLSSFTDGFSLISANVDDNVVISMANAIGLSLSQYPSENIDYERLKNENSNLSRNIITAGGKKQEAVDGLFTRFLKTGLTGAADYNRDNYITSNELDYYLKSNVAKEDKKYSMEQIPQFGSIISDQGEIVFSKDK